MSDEQFIEKYEELLNKGYCDCNEMNCLDNDVPTKILNIVKGTKLEAKQLLEENQELKKQLEKKYEKVGTLTGELLYEENTKLINQQKEFIEWLEDKINFWKDKIFENVITENDWTLTLWRNKLGILEESLSKYKETIGGSNANISRR